MFEIRECTFEPFAVIGLVGTSDEGPGYVDALWQRMNRYGKSIMHLAKKDDDGEIMGAWGLMNDDSLSFLPPDERKSKKVVYLAGIETDVDAKPPKGYTKWLVPAFDYVYAPVSGGKDKAAVIREVMAYLDTHDLTFAACPFDFMPPGGGDMYLFFPVKADPDK